MNNKTNNHLYTGIFLAALVAIMSGCTKLGPDFNGVEKVQIPEEWKHDTSLDDNATLKWWEVFKDPVLDSMVEKAYAQNLDIKSAGLRILQARAVLGISEGLTYPQVQKLSGNAALSHQNEQNFASAGIGFDIGWEMDIWGKYARGIESSTASLYASVASYQNIMVSVISEVARNYVSYRTAEERIAYAKRNVAIQERVTKMTEIQYNSGNVSELDMQQSRTQLHNTRAILPAIELSKIKARNAIAVLLGTMPNEIEKIMADSDKKWSDSIQKYIAGEKSGVIQLKEKSSMLNISLVPVADFNPYSKIDAGLLMRRPDLKVAEYKAHAASAQIGVKTTELYPSFTLFGNIGYNTNDASGDWLSGSKPLGISAGPAFSWNILQYDRIKNQIRLQDALFEESLVNYNKKVLQAVGEVSDALHGYILTKEQLKENKKAVDATVRAFNISATQYNNGLVSYQRLLSTVENLTRTQDRYAQIRGSLATNAIFLYKALGGGWEIARGKAYVSAETAKKMGERVDWGKYLDSNMTRFPEDMR